MPGPSSGPLTSSSRSRPSGRVIVDMWALPVAVRSRGGGVPLGQWTKTAEGHPAGLGRSVDVERRLARPAADDHGASRLVGRVRLAMHRPGRNAPEVAGAGFDDVLAAGPRLHSHPAADDV